MTSLNLLIVVGCVIQMIKVISQSTSEREAETAALFQQCKPYLDQGMGLYTAVKHATGRNPTNTKSGWYRALIDYTISQGYDYNGLKWSRGGKD